MSDGRAFDSAIDLFRLYHVTISNITVDFIDTEEQMSASEDPTTNMIQNGPYNIDRMVEWLMHTDNERVSHEAVVFDKLTTKPT